MYYKREDIYYYQEENMIMAIKGFISDWPIVFYENIKQIDSEGEFITITQEEFCEATKQTRHIINERIRRACSKNGKI